MISSHVKISMISLTSSLSLRLYLNSLAYHRNIFGSSLKVFCNLWTSLEIFRNVWERSSGLRNNLGKFSETFKKNHQKHCRQFVYIIKRTLHISSKIGILCSRGKNISLVRCAHSRDNVLATRT